MQVVFGCKQEGPVKVAPIANNSSDFSSLHFSMD